MESVKEIKDYLLSFKRSQLDKGIKERLESLKKLEVSSGNQDNAKEIWCVEQMEKIIRHYLNSFKLLIEKDFFAAWRELERTDIELSFLKPHFDYKAQSSTLLFIEDKIAQIQKLFPYKYFMSRETVVKKSHCSICGATFSLRNSCDHKVGEIYNGEQCFSIIDDFEFKGAAIVKDPFDKYAVIFPEGMEYNYFMLEHLMENFKHPFEKWILVTHKELQEKFKNIRRNDPCKCNSRKKYKNCCLKSGKSYGEHYEIIFLTKSPEEVKSVPKITQSTWKTS
ncbi:MULTISPECIES: YecA family protein [Bacillus cereus group]|uniref:Zinc chelation protein SecC n=1 Tax=Bacillus cereus TaxID=1396 RepID=A0A9W7QJR0_BACCE|nr:SEC-C metal-binding domain-containing protein [Bacillus cereus]KAB2400101.1 zinc chelation protein SecC [Bacillus cereus]KAB2410471.1 zinc chelation protein SecC [Bacillus cereus]KAB2427735.1 zinc chelation protein SecC [Bacillus cereus]